MRFNNLLPPNSKVDAPSHMMVEPSHKGGQSPIDSKKEEHLSEVAPQRRQIPRSPNRASKCSCCPSPCPESFLNEERSERGRHLQKRIRSSSPPSNSPLSSETPESSSSIGSSYKALLTRKHKGSYQAWKRAKILETFKEGGKNITFLSYDGSYGQTDKVLAFVQQFDAAFGGEHFTKRSKLHHVAMHFQKSARQWWASLKTQGIDPHTWKECH